MKAALNGALNCSILDGWWAECFDGSNGWAIESAENDPDLERRDLREASSLFSILENHVVRDFYDRNGEGVPRDWVTMVLHAWASLGPQVTAARMMRDYTTALYEPAAASSAHLAADGGKPAQELSTWRQRVAAAWSDVAVTSVDVDGTDASAGTSRPVRVSVELGGLSPADVAVEVVHGPVGHDGEFNEVSTVELEPTGDGAYTGAIVIGVAGSYGVTARVIPVHADLPNRFDLGRVAYA
jgi:starch phosphorylase